MEHHHRGQWGSNLGFLMAAVGSAVGLGNIWGFPYKMGASGGFAFLVIYLILAATIGFSIMLCELAIGRKAGRSVLVSYQQVAGPMGTFLGFLAMLSPFLILSFYTYMPMRERENRQPIWSFQAIISFLKTAACLQRAFHLMRVQRLPRWMCSVL